MSTWQVPGHRQSPGRQKGLGFLALLVIAVMVGFFVMAGIRIAPGYFEYLTVRDVVGGIAAGYDQQEDSFADIRRALATDLNTNQVKSINYREIEIAREDGEVVIDASYEQRIPLVWRIDAVVKYDDLVFIAGEPISD